MKTDEIADLSKLARLIADRDLARLADIREESARLRHQVEALSRAAHTHTVQGLDAASRAGAMQLWNRWKEEELRKLQSKRAVLAAREETMRAAAQRSYGKQIALAELIKAMR